jgi:hypothetical protein
MWYESDTGALFAYYDSFWIEIGGTATYNEIIGTIQAKGDLLVGDASQSLVRLPLGSDNKRLAANSSTSTGLEWVDDNINTVVDARGDILIGATPNLMARLPLGSNGQMLAVDSSQTYGLGWVSQNTRNVLYNGAMQVGQRALSTSGISSAVQQYYTADRWATTVINTAGTWTQSIENDAPTGSGFRKSLKMLCTTATPSLGSSATAFINQRLEGQDIQMLAKGTSSANPLAVSFWVKSNKVGVYVVSFYDHDNTRQVSGSYTVNSTNLWEYKTIIIPPDTVGVFDNDNAVSLQATWFLAAGSSYTSSGSLQTEWSSYNQNKEGVGQVNLADTVNGYWQITGVQINSGTVVVPFEFKSYSRELTECQRYYQVWTSNSTGTSICMGFADGSGTAASFNRPIVPTMRTAPTNSFSGVIYATDFSVYRQLTALTSDRNTADSFTTNPSYSGGTLNASRVAFIYGTSGSINLSAEL